MHYKDVTEDIFLRAWAYEDQVAAATTESGDIRDLSQWHVVKSRCFLDLESTDERIWAFREARSWLVRLSLVALDDASSISMHILIHDWAKLRIGQDRGAQAWSTAAAVLALSTRESHSYEPYSIHLQRHLETCVATNLESNNFPVENDRKEFCRLPHTFIWQLYRTTSAKTVQAIQKMKRVCQNLSTWSTDKAQSLEIDYLLGISLQKERKDQEAKEVL